MYSSKILIKTFTTEANSGSPQYLLFFDDLEKLHLFYDSYTVDDEFDYSFIFLESNKEAYVLWKNKSGNIQFCGSGAYALSWYILQNEQDKLEVEIKSKHIKLKAYRDNHLVLLSIPLKTCTFYKETSQGKLFLNTESGIYLLEKDELNLNEGWIDNFLSEEGIEDIHGLCVFNWKRGEGKLRYFVPWHGRDEDYVTGSIHQYLTSLVYLLYKEEKQKWIQLSEFGGGLDSRVLDFDRICLSGDCRQEF